MFVVQMPKSKLFVTLTTAYNKNYKKFLSDSTFKVLQILLNKN